MSTHRILPVIPELTTEPPLTPPPPSPVTPPNTQPPPSYSDPELLPFDSELVNDLYDKLRALTIGIKYNASNWVLLANKAIILVSSKELKLVKNMTLAQRVELACLLTIEYLDEETAISDELLDLIRDTLPNILNKWILSFQSNKKNHKKTSSNQRKTQKNVSKKIADVVAEDTITPARIEELLISRIEALVHRGTISNFSSFQSELPSLIIMAITVVDKYGHLSTAEKRELIAQTMAMIISEKVPNWFNLDSTQTHRAELLAASLPTLIETTTTLVNGEIPEKIDFREMMPLASECITSIFKMCRK